MSTQPNHPGDDEPTRAWLSEGEPPGDEVTLPESPDAAASGNRLVGRFELLQLLGRGGMGDVYLARHLKLKKTVALKLLPAERMNDPQAVARFRREVQVLSDLAHPNIVRFENAGADGDDHYLVMEYVPGVNLEQLLAQLGPLPVADACQMIGQAAVGLEHAHHYGLVHRDIKPSNLMLSTCGAVKVLDLGVALLADAEGLTGSGRTLGTLAYMAPEQARPGAEVDIRSDIYSLGCTLFALLTGKPPFGDEQGGPRKMALAHVGAPPPNLLDVRPDAPPLLGGIVAKMLEKNPDARFATPAEVVQALAPLAVGCDVKKLLERVDIEPVVSSGPRGSTVDSAEYLATATDSHPREISPPRRRSRKRLVFGVLAICTLVGLFLGGAYWFSPEAQDPSPPPVAHVRPPPAPPVEKPAPPPPPVVQVVDWDQLDWPDPIHLSRNYAFDDVELRISLSGDLDFPRAGPSPSDNQKLQGGLEKAEDNLWLVTNWTRDDAHLLVELAFSEAVTDVSFRVFDVDRNELPDGGVLQDQVIVKGYHGQQRIAATIEGGPANRVENDTILGSAPSLDTGAPSGEGNARVTFRHPIERIELHFTQGPDADRQGPLNIGLHDVRFTPARPFAVAYIHDWDQTEWPAGGHRWHTFPVGETEVTVAFGGQLAFNRTSPPTQWTPNDLPDPRSEHDEAALVVDAYWAVNLPLSTTLVFQPAVEQLALAASIVGPYQSQVSERTAFSGYFRGQRVDAPKVTRRSDDADDSSTFEVRFGQPVDRIVAIYGDVEGAPAAMKPHQFLLHDVRFIPAAASAPEPSSAAHVVVLATADPGLGVNSPITSASSDALPSETPVELTDLQFAAGGAVSFAAEGKAWTGYGRPLAGPNGQMSTTSAPPQGALVGVFLDHDGPTGPPTNFGIHAAAFAERVQAPQLGDWFFIGDGQTADGQQRLFVVPAGGRRMLLGVADAASSYDNVGSFDVRASAAPPSPGELLLIADKADDEIFVGEIPVPLDETAADGRRIARIKLAAGRHEITLRRGGEVRYVREFALAPGETTSLDVAPPAEVDLADMLVPQRDVLWGDIKRPDDAWLLDAGESAQGLIAQIPYRPPAAYRLRASLERLEGDGHLAIGLLVEGRPCLLAIDDGGGQNWFTSLSRVNNLTPRQQAGAYREQLLPLGETVEISITVSPDAVRVQSGESDVYQWQGDPAALTLTPTGVPLYENVLWLQASSGRFEVRELMLTPIRDEGRAIALDDGGDSIDRRAAQRALWKGGKVRVISEGRSALVETLEQLPPAFVLTGVYPRDDKSNFALNDEDLRLIAQSPGLTSLTVKHSRVTDAGLAHIAQCRELYWLVLSNTDVTDKGMEHLSELTRLQTLFLASTDVGDAGLAQLRGLHNLQQIGLSTTQVGDEGIEALAPSLDHVKWLCMCGTRVTERSVPLLSKLTTLEELHLGNAPVADSDLAPLANLTHLKVLRLVGTQVTDGGVAAVKSKLPQCVVQK